MENGQTPLKSILFWKTKMKLSEIFVPKIDQIKGLGNIPNRQAEIFSVMMKPSQFAKINGVNRDNLKFENQMVDEIKPLGHPDDKTRSDIEKSSWDRKINSIIKSVEQSDMEKSVLGKVLGTVDVILYRQDENTDMFVVLKNKKESIGYIELTEKFIEIADISGYACESGLFSQHVGKGIGFATYKLLISKNIDLISGSEQTPGSQNIWKQLMKTHGVLVRAFDDEEELKLNDIDPWSDPDIFLYATKTK